MGSLPEGVSFQKCNVAVWLDVVKLFQETHRLHGKIDVVCPNAGVNDRSNLLRDDLEEPDFIVMDVNLKGVMMCMFQ
jgi:NAD(P)-dependent dehydrogenase (short-subunit alcohol dehydrogenase family)